MTALPPIVRAGLLAGAFALAGCSSSMMPGMSPDQVGLRATLSGAAEVPPNDSSGTGQLQATLDKPTRTLRWDLSYGGLSGPATMAHFHGPAMPGANAPVAVPIAPPGSPSKGQATLTDAQMNDLLSGKWYVNVHTAAHPGGEIRGQVLTK